MQASIRFSLIITLAALSLSGSSVWAQDSFVAKATLKGADVVPSVLSVYNSELCLKISEPPTTTAQAIGRLQRRPRSNPWQLSVSGTGVVGFVIPVRNARLYFGQSLANGQPILTLCDNDTKFSDKDEDKCPEVKVGDDFDVKGPNFDLNSIQFQREQIDGIRNPPFDLVDEAGRLFNDLPCDAVDNTRRGECGFSVIKRLIGEGLIYVVYNSDFKAKKRKDGTIKHEPPKGRLVVDGDFRGTLSIADLKDCPFTPPPEEE